MNEHKGYRPNNTLPNVILILQTQDHANLEQELHRFASDRGLTRNGFYEHFCGNENVVTETIELILAIGRSRKLPVFQFQPTNVLDNQETATAKNDHETISDNETADSL
jgi:hypothetical protein